MSGVIAAGLRIRLLSGLIDGLIVSTTFSVVTFGIVRPLSARFDTQNAFVVARLAARLGVPAELLAGSEAGNPGGSSQEVIWFDHEKSPPVRTGGDFFYQRSDESAQLSAD